eukprot:scaffold14562_cov133-Isochrysis_galbana.AAC.6
MPDARGWARLACAPRAHLSPLKRGRSLRRCRLNFPAKYLSDVDSACDGAARANVLRLDSAARAVRGAGLGWATCAPRTHLLHPKSGCSNATPPLVPREPPPPRAGAAAQGVAGVAPVGDERAAPENVRASRR